VLAHAQFGGDVGLGQTVAQQHDQVAGFVARPHAHVRGVHADFEDALPAAVDQHRRRTRLMRVTRQDHADARAAEAAVAYRPTRLAHAEQPCGDAHRPAVQGQPRPHRIQPGFRTVQQTRGSRVQAQTATGGDLL